jgi:cell division protein FtsI/penicillin-binding protein 2
MRPITARAMTLMFTMLLLLASALGRLLYLQIQEREAILERAAAIRQQSRQLLPNRGAILDRHGRVLANSVWLQSVVANPAQIADKPAVAAELGPILGMKPEQILGILLDPPSPGFAWIKRRIGPEQAQAVDRRALPGIATIPEPVRQYPQGPLAAQVVGFVGADGNGLEGLELYYEQELRGHPGRITAEFTLGEVPIHGTVTRLQPSQEGKTLVLTLDAALQKTVEQHLDQVLKKEKAKRVLVLAMEVETGDILVMAMRPGFDLNNLRDVSPEQMRNWAVTDLLQPGSIFKPLTVAAALEERAITLTDTFTDEGTILMPGGVPIRNWDGGVPHSAPVTVKELLGQSSNVGLIKIGRRIGNERFVNYLEAFGLLRPSRIDFPGEPEPYLGENWAEKREIDWANMFIGQHLGYTPVQMLQAMAALANGGTLVQPRLVSELRSADGAVVEVRAPARRQVLSAHTAAEIRELMIYNVEKGTGGLAITPGFRVGGKTGTAEKFERGIRLERFTAGFVGFAPAEAPRVAVLVLVDEPEGKGFGGLVAAPVFSALLPEIMSALAINPDPARLPKEPPRPKAVTPDPVPSLLWLPVTKALEKAFLAGYTPKLKGEGALVTAQGLKPGTVGKPGAVLELTADPTPRAEGLRVPSLLGMPLSEAGDVLHTLNLVLKAEGTGFVVAQDPKPGSLLPPRGTVRVQLSGQR